MCATSVKQDPFEPLWPIWIQFIDSKWTVLCRLYLDPNCQLPSLLSIINVVCTWKIHSSTFYCQPSIESSRSWSVIQLRLHCEWVKWLSLLCFSVENWTRVYNPSSIFSKLKRFEMKQNQNGLCAWLVLWPKGKKKPGPERKREFLWYVAVISTTLHSSLLMCQEEDAINQPLVDDFGRRLYIINTDYCTFTKYLTFYHKMNYVLALKSHQKTLK